MKTEKRGKLTKKGSAAKQEGRGKLSLYPLDLETALGAALKTGAPRPEPKKTGRATNKKR